ncbi:MAG: hypothetical protein ABF391_16320, partial [Akkermansiaceae bacterium]
MKNIISFAFFVYALLSSFLAGQVIYDASAADPNPATQGWSASEIVLGAAGNAGAVTVDGEIAWQLDDRLTGGTENNPFYKQTIPASYVNELYTQGWEFEFTFRIPGISPEGRYSGFTGWVIRPADAPAAWSVSSGRVARV